MENLTTGKKTGRLGVTENVEKPFLGKQELENYCEIN